MVNKMEETKVPNKKKEIRAETMLQRMGFRDKDLYNQAHDNICLWISKPENYGPFIKLYLPEWYNLDNNSLISIICERTSTPEDDWYIKDLETTIEEYLARNPINQFFLQLKNDRKKAIFDACKSWLSKRDIGFTTQLEEIITSGVNRYTIGFLDFHIHFQFPKKMESKIVFANGKWAIDFNIIAWLYEDFFFEVKSAYGSLGELLREINLYREFTRPKHIQTRTNYKTNCDDIWDVWVQKWYLVGPLNPKIPDFRTELYNQMRITFIECPPELVAEIHEEKEKQYQSLESCVKDLLARVGKIEKKLNMASNGQQSLTDFTNKK